MKKWIYNLITLATLILPTGTFLILSATVFSLNPDIIIKNAVVEDLIISDNFIYTENKDALYDGVIAFNDDIGEWGVFYQEDDLILVGKNYYNSKWEDVKKFQLQEETKKKLPVVLIIGGFWSLVAVAVYFKKMQFHRKYPQIAVVLSFWLITGTFYIINLLIAPAFKIFLTATISVSVYIIEYTIYHKGLLTLEIKEAQSMLQREMKRKRG